MKYFIIFDNYYKVTYSQIAESLCFINHKEFLDEVSKGKKKYTITITKNNYKKSFWNKIIQMQG